MDPVPQSTTNPRCRPWWMISEDVGGHCECWGSHSGQKTTWKMTLDFLVLDSCLFPRWCLSHWLTSFQVLPRPSWSVSASWRPFSASSFPHFPGCPQASPHWLGQIHSRVSGRLLADLAWGSTLLLLAGYRTWSRRVSDGLGVSCPWP